MYTSTSYETKGIKSRGIPVGLKDQKIKFLPLRHLA